VDLDLGNYERFLDVTLTKDNNITTGKIYQVLPLAPNLFVRQGCFPRLRPAFGLASRHVRFSPWCGVISCAHTQFCASTCVYVLRHQRRR
jgi:CTP synthase N-terminus